MATWTTDIAGTGLAHTKPPGRNDIRRQKYIAERWEDWVPILTYELRQKQMDVGQEMQRLQRVHSVRMALLLRAGMTLMRIYAQKERIFDDPRLPDGEWQQMFKKIERNLKERKRKDNSTRYAL